MAINPTRALQRSISIAQLHVPTFEEVEADTSATIEAGVIVVASAVIGSIGALFLAGFWGFLAWIIATVGGWYVWAWCSSEIAKRLFNVPTTDVGEMLRVIGYGSAPRALGAIPFLGLISLIWTLTAVVFGIRQAGEMTTIQAVVTAAFGMVPTLLAYLIILLAL